LRGVWLERPPRRPSRGTPVASKSSPRWPTLALAWRNVCRAPWRSALAGAALSLGLAAFIFVQALAAGFMKQMSDNTTGFVTGELQVQHPLFRHQMQPAWHFNEQEPWLARLRERPEVAGVSLRLQSEATVSSSRKAEAVLLVGMDAQAERQVTRLHEAVVQGHLPASPLDAVLGKKLAERLDLHVGERLVAMAQGADGGLVSESFVVSGILDTGSHGPDAGMVYIALDRARQLLGQPGSASAALLRLQPREGAAAQLTPPQALNAMAALPALKALLPADGSRQLLSWQELVPEVAQTVNLVKHGVLLILAIVFLMVATIAMNSLLMSVMERSREFGTLMSLGASPRTLLRLVAGEAGVLAALGAGAGLLMGGALVAHYAWTGLRLRAHGAESLGLGDIVHPQFSGPAMLGAAAVLCLLVLLASLVPALRIGSREPVSALRQP
ncbi:ABC transporter permease, partial [Mitsuaria sp. WAJ17]|uniref:ABC transporter permease n=1 Tax=Mitsuaria sp. WAJ17 TaxID=2761452 RepID=UPI00160069DE